MQDYNRLDVNWLRMAKYSKSQIDKAGWVLAGNKPIDGMSVSDANDILTYYRYIHTPVINTFQSSWRVKMSTKYNKNGFIAQRLKRTPSIIRKINKEENMRLSRMQDIAGLRIVMKRLDDVQAISEEIKRTRNHELKGKVSNYIENPKNDGYRSIHFVFKYCNTKLPDSDGLLLEIQVRTKLQHVWATAVETLEIFTGTALKSNEGDIELRRFLALASSTFALMEKTNVCPQHIELSPRDIFEETVSAYDKLNIYDKLAGLSTVMDVTSQDKEYNGSAYQLIILDFINRQVTITSFKQSELKEANVAYTTEEKKATEQMHVALLSVDKMNTIRQAYPNYFLDTQDFIYKIELVRERLKRMNRFRDNPNQLSLFRPPNHPT